MLDTLSFHCLHKILVVLLFSWKGREASWGLNLGFLHWLHSASLSDWTSHNLKRTQERFLCFSCRRCQQTLLQTICYTGGSAEGEPSGSQGPVPPCGVLGPAARGHPHPAPQPGEAPALPPAAPPPLPAEAAAGLRHLRHSPGEAALLSSGGGGWLCPAAWGEPSAASAGWQQSSKPASSNSAG